MAETLADTTVAALGPEHLPAIRALSQGLIGVAFAPDMATDDDDDDDAPDAAADTSKKP